MSKKKESIENLRTKTIGELEAMLTDTRKELADIILRIKAAQNSNLKEPRKLRVKIAHIMTVMHELSTKESMQEQVQNG